MAAARDGMIDLLRGIAFLDMMLVHFSHYLPRLPEKIINYSDFAIEAFIVLSGYVVGRRFPFYLQQPRTMTIRLWRRAGELYLVQCILILSVSVPMFCLKNPSGDVPVFLIQSLLLLNQVGLIHILPTFIPLLLISPVILLGFRRNLNWLVMAASVAVFAAGNVHPYLLDVGENTIFPFILWQIYFVAGCFLGAGNFSDRLPAERRFVIAGTLLIIVLSVRFAHAIPPPWFSKFPLNALGLAYGSSLLYFIYSSAALIRRRSTGKPLLLFSIVSMFGKYSLLAFVLHAYTERLTGIISSGFRNPVVDYGLIITGVAVIYGILSVYDSKGKMVIPVLWSGMMTRMAGSAKRRSIERA
ncbi:MAG: OpgC domain-containing protein [Syntrophales bacterium]|nr:OpgC domain-containing protein [Syntrophales bacterium]MDD5531154.1 OpgC domain-containing protein [Syntrophales bacterium]